ncbi:MAG: hypothetical protein ABR499_06835 [Gemmatimonadaceae bacterium]
MALRFLADPRNASPAAACLALLLAAVAPARNAHAQRADSARAAAARATRPPLSPRRAFVASLVAPGYAQSVLGRPNASALFILTEAIGVLMVGESARELREARRFEDDSVALYFVNPISGAPDTIYQSPRYSSALVRARRAHLEDWIAALVANHIIAAADAFVAAHLWDVPAHVGLYRAGRGASISARFRW